MATNNADLNLKSEQQAQKVAVVTGASRGLGAEICRMLSREGYALAMGARDLNALDLLSKQLDGVGRHTIHQLNLTEENSVCLFASDLLKQHGRVDLLVNNAGIGIFRRLEEIEATEFDELFLVNVKGPWLLTKTLLPALKQSRALVTMISSDVSTRTFVNGGAYTATKFALRAITRTFQQENPDLRFLELRTGAIDTFFAGSTQGAAGKDGFLDVASVAEALRAVLRLPAEARVEEIVLRSVQQAVEY